MLRTTFLLAAVLCAHVGLAQLSIEATAYSTRCAGSSTGLVELIASGAIGAVTYQTNFNLAALPAGAYTMEATDCLLYTSPSPRD